MSYEAEVKISVTVKDGPPAVQGKHTIYSISDANTKRLSFMLNDRSSVHSLSISDKDYPDNSDSPKWTRRVRCRTLQLPADGDLAFVAIKSNRYSYKKCFNKDTAGIGVSLKKDFKPEECNEADCDKPIWISSEFVMLSFCGELKNRKSISILVDEELFDCTKKEPDEIIITLSYGLVLDDIDNSPDDGTRPCCDPIDKGSKESAQLQRRKVMQA